MIRMHLTPFQLFFLTFLYVFSGLTLSGAESLFALLIPFAAAMLWTLIGTRGATRYREDLTDFLCAYMQRRETGLVLIFFLAVSAAQAVLQLCDMTAAVGETGAFLPFATVLLVILASVITVCRLGVTVLGRLAELSLFLLIPLVVLHLFGSWRPMAPMGMQADLHAVFSVLPAPFFFLSALSAVAGDTGATDSLGASSAVPRHRAVLVCGVMIGGAALACALRALILVKPFAQAELLLLFLEYVAHMAKLALLLCVCAYGVVGRRSEMRAATAAVMAMSAVATAAILGGAFFSPFYWILLLTVPSAAAALMLGIFAVR